MRECAHKGQGGAPVQLLRMQATGDTGTGCTGGEGEGVWPVPESGVGGAHEHNGTC